MAVGNKVLQGFRYRVTFSDVPGVRLGTIAFSTISGMNAAAEVVEYREGDDPITMRKFPGLVSFDNITFERGLLYDVDEDASFNWMEAMNTLKELGGPNLGDVGQQEFRSKEITLDIFSRQDSLPQRTFKIKNAFIANLSIADLDASGSDILIVSMEVAHEGFYEV